MDSIGVYNHIRQNFGDELTKLQQAVMLFEVERFREELSENLNGSVKDWMSLITEEYKVSIFELKVRSRKRAMVRPRQIIMWGLQEQVVSNKLTLEAIGHLFNQDHATALHAKRTINQLIETEPVFREAIMMLLNKMGWRTEWRFEEKKLHKYGFSSNVA